MEFDTNGLDAIDQEIIRKLIIARDQNGEPRIGDYVRFSTGELERFSHDWGDGLQTSAGGSFFLCNNGGASFSGGLNPCTSADKLEQTDAELPGSFWIFHHNVAGAGRGVHFKIPCRVYLTTASYEGFLGKDFCSHEIDALKKQLESDLIRQIAILTGINAHGEAYQLGAKTLGLIKLSERFADINRRHLQLGYLSHELDLERMHAYEELMGHARTHMEAADYQQFYMAM
jgi:hypothetical protein